MVQMGGGNNVLGMGGSEEGSPALQARTGDGGEARRGSESYDQSLSCRERDRRVHPLPLAIQPGGEEDLPGRAGQGTGAGTEVEGDEEPPVSRLAEESQQLPRGIDGGVGATLEGRLGDAELDEAPVK
jgi:hypothetical protein